MMGGVAVCLALAMSQTESLSSILLHASHQRWSGPRADHSPLAHRVKRTLQEPLRLCLEPLAMHAAGGNCYYLASLQWLVLCCWGQPPKMNSPHRSNSPAFMGSSLHPPASHLCRAPAGGRMFQVLGWRESAADVHRSPHGCASRAHWPVRQDAQLAVTAHAPPPLPSSLLHHTLGFGPFHWQSRATSTAKSRPASCSSQAPSSARLTTLCPPARPWSCQFRKAKIGRTGVCPANRKNSFRLSFAHRSTRPPHHPCSSPLTRFFTSMHWRLQARIR